jgi:hypothetical protein
MTLESKLNPELWYNMDYGVPMHEFFLTVMEPDEHLNYMMAFELAPLVYIVSTHPEYLTGKQYSH